MLKECFFLTKHNIVMHYRYFMCMLEKHVSKKRVTYWPVVS